MTTGTSPLDPEAHGRTDGAVETRVILGVRVHATDYADATRRAIAWARAGEGRTVYATGAHGLIEAQDDAAFRAVLNGADLNVPDGVPLVWALRAQGVKDASRVYGPDLTLHLCAAAAASGVSVAFYGSTPAVLAALRARLAGAFPTLRIAATISPPFRPLTDDEDAALTRELRDSGAGLVFVGLGCPRQERWCDAHRDRLPAVLVAVGAAFDFHAGVLRQAPPLVQRAGFEWAFRLAVEPRRLWRRYARVVPRFTVGYARQRLTGRGSVVEAAE